MKRFVVLIAAIAALSVVGAASASAATVVNGNFESGTSGWTLANDPGGAGHFTTYSGSIAPESIPLPVQAAHGVSLISAEHETSAGIAYQDVALEPGYNHSLKLNYFAINNGSDWSNPLGTVNLPPSGSAQVARIDVIKPTADPWSTNPADVLATIYAPKPGDPLSIGWTAGTADLTPFAGQTVRIRAGFTATSDEVFVALDDVSITSKDVTAPTVTGLTGKSPSYRYGRGGFKIPITTSEQTTLLTTFYKATAGKKSGKNCVKPSKRNKKAKNCLRWVKVPGTLKQYKLAGANTFRFSGRVKNKRLKPGSYKAVTVATDVTGNAAAPITTKFTVLPKKK